jgi:L-seryl-tRNA(Ser) seleniumtransferase
VTEKRPEEAAGQGAAERDKAAGAGADLRGLAAVDEVLRQPGVAALLHDFPRTVVVDAVRAVIDRLRSEILAGERVVSAGELSAAMLVPWVDSLVRLAVRPSLSRVVNALGVVGHTNLGRAILPYESIDAIAMAAGNYTDLEMSLVTNERASRQDHLHDILCTLTGAEDALVVNNNAAAVLLALTAAARGGDVLVARGQLVEIGDAFRIPDILRESGAELVEVGTTNRTYLRDYEKAWSKRTRAVLRVHSSNYRIVGFATEPSVQELAGLAHDRGALCIDDLGSGALAELPLFADEPPVRQSVDAGADIVTFSGDKLLGGPQAGIAVGRAASVHAMRKHPLARALRIDKLSVAALDALLRLYLDPERAVQRVPTLAMLAAGEEELQARAERLKELVMAAWPQAGERLEVVPTVARAGAGALPVTDVRSRALAVDPPGGDAGGLAERLRRGEPAVLARVHGDRVLLDVLAVRDTEVDELAVAVATALA